MSYVFYSIISAFFLALYDLLKKISTKKGKDIYEILFFYTTISFFLSFFFVDKAISINISYILLIFLKSCIISLSWYFTMKSMCKLDLSVVVPFSILGTIFTTIFAVIFFNEKLEILQVVGILFILIGLFFLSKVCRKEENSRNDYKYLFLLALAAFLSSISALIDKVLLNNIDKGSVLFWFFGFLSLIYLVVYLLKNKKIKIINIVKNIWVVGIGASIFLSDLFYYKAVGYDNALLSIVSLVKKLSVFISVVLASLFLKEKNLLKKVLILLLMFLGMGGILFF